MLTTRPPISPRAFAARSHLRRDSLDQPHRRAHVRGPDLVGHLVAEAECAFRRQPIGWRAVQHAGVVDQNVYLGQSVHDAAYSGESSRRSKSTREICESRSQSLKSRSIAVTRQPAAWSRVAIALPMPRARTARMILRFQLGRWSAFAAHEERPTGPDREACRRSGSTSLLPRCERVRGVKRSRDHFVCTHCHTSPIHNPPSPNRTLAVAPQSSSLTAGCSSNSTSTENSGSNSLHLRSLCAPSTSDLT